ncbi:MAG: twin-arginine translocation signal domain-containing protein [Anaerolineales bacterium]|nr:twin-arginine translocation signal domain-containing protein [Anaerolineales bacterium]
MTLTRRDFLKMYGLFAMWAAFASYAPNEAITQICPSHNPLSSFAWAR